MSDHRRGPLTCGGTSARGRGRIGLSGEDTEAPLPPGDVMRGLKRVARRFDDWLSAIDPAAFELLLAGHCRQAGSVVQECGTGGPDQRFDGGVDLRLLRGSGIVLVQCKLRNAVKVAHNPVTSCSVSCCPECDPRHRGQRRRVHPGRQARTCSATPGASSPKLTATPTSFTFHHARCTRRTPAMPSVSVLATFMGPAGALSPSMARNATPSTISMRPPLLAAA